MQVNSVTISATGTNFGDAVCNDTNFAFVGGTPSSGPPPSSVYTTHLPTSIGPGDTVTVLSSSSGQA